MRLPHLAVVFIGGMKPINRDCTRHLRVKIGEEARYIVVDVPRKIRSTELLGTEDNWISSSQEFAFEINNKIREKKNIILGLINRNYTFNKNLSFETILRHLSRKGDRISFYDYRNGYIQKPPEKLENNTIKKYVTCLNHLKSFRKQLFFSDIDNLFVRDFH